MSDPGRSPEDGPRAKAELRPDAEGDTVAEVEESRRDLRVQALGREIVSTLYMLVRNVKIHPPDNQIFLKPIESLREQMSRVIALDRQLNLQAVGTTIYLNRHPLKFDFAALENIRYLTQEFEARGLGGFTSVRPPTSQEIREFIRIFSGTGEGGAATEEAASAGSALHVQLFSRVKELLDKLEADPDLDEEVDRKKYLMTVYARAVFFMRVYFERLSRADRSIPFAKAARLVQDLVDLCHEEKTHFLGVTTTRCEDEYLAYHSVNTCLLSIVFGSELGLDKRQLHDLGMAALFSQVGLAEVPPEILSKDRPLTPEEREQVDLVPLRSAKAILSTRGLDRATMQRIVATYESKVSYAIPNRRSDGELELVLPKVGLGIYGRILSITETYDALTSRRPFREAYGPEIALALMASEIRYRFDPVLLRVFMKVMAIQPIKIFESGTTMLGPGVTA